MTAAQISRRSLFRGRTRPRTEAVRPPWIAPDGLSSCTGCGDCVSACPENIIKMDGDERPFVDFTDSGCTLCGACASICEAGVFGPVSEPAWQAEVVISPACLLASGVACQVCTDFCDTEALQFDLSVRPAGALRVSQDDCTGCGFCVGACPVTAITLRQSAKKVPA